MMAGFCLWLLKIDFTPVRMQVTDNTVAITSGYSNISFDRDEIEDLQLLDALPDDNFYKINGSTDGKQYLGKFKGKETGKCHRYLRLRCQSIRFLLTVRQREKQRNGIRN